VTVLVGPSQSKFIVHKKLLIEASAYFAKAINGPWSEARSGVFELVLENAEAFELFIQWLYGPKIQACDNLDLQDLLVHAWACGDRLQVPDFKNVVINMLFADWAPYRVSSPMTGVYMYPPSYAIAALAMSTHHLDQY